MKNKLYDILKNPQGKVIAMDLDKVLTTETAWNDQTALDVKPNLEMIKISNDLCIRGAFLVIHTARRHEMYLPTVRWLEIYGVKYHAICMEKMPSDCYIDDKALNLEDLKEDK